MKLRIQRLGFAALIIAAANLAVIEGCGSPPPHEKRTGRLLDDKVTAARVRAALTNNISYEFPRVVVATTNGTVTLSGYVENEVQRREATTLTQSVGRVTKVENVLQIQPSLTPVGRPSNPGTTYEH